MMHLEGIEPTSREEAMIHRAREAIKDQFVHAYHGYEEYAFGHDELKPVSKRGGGGYGMGLTIIDGLDTMIIMGLEEQYKRGVEWISKYLTFGHPDQEDINLFETTIRCLGGLLSAHALRPSDKVLMDKAVALADAMSFAFESKTGLPYSTLGLSSKRKYNPCKFNYYVLFIIYIYFHLFI